MADDELLDGADVDGIELEGDEEEPVPESEAPDDTAPQEDASVEEQPPDYVAQLRAENERLKREVGAQSVEIGLMRDEVRQVRGTEKPKDDDVPDEPVSPEQQTANDLYQKRGGALVARWRRQGMSDEDIRANAECQDELSFVWEDCQAIASVTESRVRSTEERVRGEVSPLITQRAQSEISAGVDEIIKAANIANVSAADLADDIAQITPEGWSNTSPEDRTRIITRLAKSVAYDKQAAKTEPAPPAKPNARTTPVNAAPTPTAATKDARYERIIAMKMQASPSLTREAAVKGLARYLENGGTLNDYFER